MKYYSDVTKQLYDSEKELVAAETKVEEVKAKKVAEEKAKKEARATRAKEVENAIKAADEAQAKANKLLSDFTKDYGYFHMSYSTEDIDRVFPPNFLSDALKAFLG